MKRQNSYRFRPWIAGLLSLAQVALCQADFSNTAHVSFADQAGAMHTAVSNTVFVIVQKPPVVGSFDHLPATITLHDTIQVTITNAFDEVLWTFSPLTISPSVKPIEFAAGAPGQTIATRSPALSLNTAPQLHTGRWHIRVTASNAAGTSAPLEADIDIVGTDLQQVLAYPNPWRASRGDGEVTFTQLPAESTVKIFTVSGRWVKTLTASQGLATWDVTTDAGEKAASGLYLFLITDDQGHKTHGKIVVIR